MVPVQGSYDATAMCLRATGLRFFQICHCAELNKIVEATMPVNPYDVRKVSLRRTHGNGDLDIVGALYTRRKANVTEALVALAHVLKNLHKTMLTSNIKANVEGRQKPVHLNYQFLNSISSNLCMLGNCACFLSSNYLQIMVDILKF